MMYHRAHQSNFGSPTFRGSHNRTDGALAPPRTPSEPGVAALRFDTHESLTIELAGADPTYHGVDNDVLHCALCHADLEQDHKHGDDCLWIRAQVLLAR